LKNVQDSPERRFYGGQQMPDQGRRNLCRLGLSWLAAFCLPNLRPADKGMAAPGAMKGERAMKLPPPKLDGGLTVATAIDQRRTVRAFAGRELALDHLAQLLWAAQGITGRRYKRAAPSAGALYPMDLYAVIGAGSVGELTAGVYHYRPETHGLTLVAEGDLRMATADAALGQRWMAGAPVNLVITAEYGRVTVKYRERGVRYAMIEAGHIGQNLFLQAEALGLKAGIVGAFQDQVLGRMLHLAGTHEPLLIMPVGYSKRSG
jgi:SagB-type dehydrogenase family enzyme